MKSIGEIYFDSSFFVDEASKTMGTAAVGPNAVEIIQNRRKVTGRLKIEGQNHLAKIESDLKTVFPNDKIKIVWDRHCGCSMCPCSPGYRIKIDRDIRSLDKYRFSLHIDNQGNYSFFRPVFAFEVGVHNLEKLENCFK